LVVLILLFELIFFLLLFSKVLVDKLLLRVDILHGRYLNHLVIMPGLNLFNSFSLINHNLKSNFAEIIHKHVLLNNESDLRADLEDVEPFLFSYEETLDMCQSSINECCSFIKGNSVSSNNTLIIELNTISPLFVDLITNDNLTFADETYFIEFIEFVYKDGMLAISSRFKMCQKAVHEVSVILVDPSIIISTDTS
jgi:hypothetical protein